MTPRPAALARLRRRVLDVAARLGPGGASVSPRAYAEATSDDDYFHRTLTAAAVQRAPLPRNVGRRENLPQKRDPWGFSFHDVPEREVEPRAIARLPECRVSPYRNPAGSVFHRIRTVGGRKLELRSVGPRPGEELTRVGTKRRVDCGEAAWIVRRWHRNYYHWLVDHLPQVLVLQECGMERAMLIPHRGPNWQTMIDSLEALGVTTAELRPAPAGPWRADPFWVVETDRFDPRLLRALRDRVAGDAGAATRRVYVSREGARKRRLANPAAALGALEATGFEIVEAGRLSFREQVALASETTVLLGIHGAGLANMIFMPEGRHVVEIVHPHYPSPIYYALASALGLRYWLVWGTPDDARGREKLDLEIDPRELERVIYAIEADG